MLITLLVKTLYKVFEAAISKKPNSVMRLISRIREVLLLLNISKTSLNTKDLNGFSNDTSGKRNRNKRNHFLSIFLNKYYPPPSP
jgi:hypothetical protein